MLKKNKEKFIFLVSSDSYKRLSKMIAFRIQKVVAKKNKIPMAFLSTLERASVKIKQYFRFARLPFATVNKECALAFIRCCFFG